MMRLVSVPFGLLAGVGLGLAGCGSSTGGEAVPGALTAVAGGLVHPCGPVGGRGAVCWGDTQCCQRGDGAG